MINTGDPRARIREAIGYDAYRPTEQRHLRWLLVAFIACVVVALIVQEIYAFSGEWP